MLDVPKTNKYKPTYPHSRTVISGINTRIAETQEAIFRINEMLDRDDLDEDQRLTYQQRYECIVRLLNELLQQMRSNFTST